MIAIAPHGPLSTPTSAGGLMSGIEAGVAAVLTSAALSLTSTTANACDEVILNERAGVDPIEADHPTASVYSVPTEPTGVGPIEETNSMQAAFITKTHNFFNLASEDSDRPTVNFSDYYRMVEFAFVRNERMIFDMLIDIANPKQGIWSNRGILFRSVGQFFNFNFFNFASLFNESTDRIKDVRTSDSHHVPLSCFDRDARRSQTSILFQEAKQDRPHIPADAHIAHPKRMPKTTD